MPFDTARKLEFQQQNLGLRRSYLAPAYQFVNLDWRRSQGGKHSLLRILAWWRIVWNRAEIETFGLGLMGLNRN